MTTMSQIIKPNHTDAFYYDINDYLQKYYSMQLTKTSDDNNVSNMVKAVR